MFYDLHAISEKRASLNVLLFSLSLLFNRDAGQLIHGRQPQFVTHREHRVQSEKSQRMILFLFEKPSNGSYF